MRGDSVYAREDIMKWCEDQKGVDYVLAMATNSQLKLRASDVIALAQQDYQPRLQPVTVLMEKMFSPDEKLDEAAAACQKRNLVSFCVLQDSIFLE